MEGERAGKFYEAQLGASAEGEVTETVTGRFFFLEMCLAWGKTPGEMQALPRTEFLEMWIHWRWRQEREHMLREQQEMQQRQYVRGG